MPHYKVIESRRYVNDAGRRASIYGACPWHTESQRIAENWRIETVGYTVQDLSSGTVGIGRVPWQDRETAQKWAETQDAQYLPK